MAHDMNIRNIHVKHHIRAAPLMSDTSRGKVSIMSLAEIRKQRGLTQNDVAEMARVDQSMVSKIENGFDGVTLRTLKQIASALGVEVSEIVGESRSAAERTLIEAFRQLPPHRQDSWLDVVAALIPDRQPNDP